MLRKPMFRRNPVAPKQKNECSQKSTSRKLPRKSRKNRERVAKAEGNSCHRKSNTDIFATAKNEKRRIALQNRKEALFWDVLRRNLCYRKNEKVRNCVAKSEGVAVFSKMHKIGGLFCRNLHKIGMTIFQNLHKIGVGTNEKPPTTAQAPPKARFSGRRH